MSTIATAQREYYARPQDERIPSLAALLTLGDAKKRNSLAKTYNAKDLTIDATAGSIAVRVPSGAQAAPSHWAFGQLARSVGAPAGYLRTLPPELISANLNHGLTHTPPSTDLNLLLTLDPTQPDALPTVRAATSERYGRVWDVDLHRPVIDTLTSGRDGQDWHLPTAWDGKPAGAYVGDRDSFLLLINGGSIVEDPSAQQGNGAMYRGIMLRNSEVGACSIVIETVFFRFVCGNLMLWGAAFDQRFRRRHVGDNAGRDAKRTAYELARGISQRSASQDESLVRGLISHELASTEAGVMDELKKLKLTDDEAKAAWISAIAQDQNPRSYWGIAQGITATSQESGYQDERYALDLKAAAVLKQGRVLVAA